jgi:hypothetical protein
VGNIETAVVGYGPGKTGPMAIVPWRERNGDYVLKAVHLGEVQILNLPPKLKQKLTKLSDKRHKRALENTRKMADTIISTEPTPEILTDHFTRSPE